MGRRKNSSADNPSKDRENCKNSSADNPSKDREGSWKKILKGYVDLVQDLLIERKSLEKRIRSQHNHISKMMRSSKEKDMFRVVDKAKANLIISMEQKKAIMHKLKFEEVEDERADLKLLFEELAQCLSEPKHVTRSNSKNFDESALKAERDFAWNQFKKTDAKLQEHKSEVEAANNKIQKLISELEQSQSLNMEKSKTISALQDDMAVLESDSRKQSEEISRLTKELELLRGDSNNHVITPILRRCNVESSSHSSDMAIIKKGDRRSSKRKGSETEPRLFTSRFKVPKLKQLST
ncbi:hypothetical protein L1887_21922 [Cichorium endivia]|nr:hypothetical protein L1887_21922 [Cichorium endivia]